MALSFLLGRAHLGLLRATGRAPLVHRTARFGRGVDVHQEDPRQIKLGEQVHIGNHCWLNVPADGGAVRIRIDRGTSIGRRSVISARNLVWIGEDCLTGPNTLFMDHGHGYADPRLPIAHQGMTPGGQIIIEPGCWIGFGAAIVCERGVLTIGRNSVVGANSVVTRSVPPFSVVVGAPARPVKQYDERRSEWRPAAPRGAAESGHART